MPPHKHTLCNSHKPTNKPKIAKEYTFSQRNANRKRDLRNE